MVDYALYYKALMDEALKRKDITRALDYALLTAKEIESKKFPSDLCVMLRSIARTLNQLADETE